MAINYLNSIDLNKNYIDNAAIQNLASAPSNPVVGQVYFNTTDQVLMVYTEVRPETDPIEYEWREVGGGIEGGGTVNAIPKFTPDTDKLGDSSITDDGTTVNFSGSLISLDGGDNEDAIVSAPGKLFIELDNDGSGTDERFEIRTTVNGNKAARLSIDDDGNTAVLGTFLSGGNAIIVGNIDVQAGTIELGGTDTRVIKGKDVPEIAGNTPGLDIITGEVYGTDTDGTDLTLSAAQSTGTGNGGDIVFKVSTPSETSGNSSNALDTAMTISGINGDALFANGISVDSDSIIYGTLTMDSEIAMSNNRITGLLDPEDDQDAATKNYVDAATVGLLEYQGGYNANTNTPILDDRGTQIAVKKGWTYTVTADGTFYGEAVRVGDVLIAEVDLAADEGALTDWTTVQNNIDLASATQIGIGNVAAATDTSLTGVDVDYPTGSPGTAVVGLDITSLTALASSIASDTTIMPVHDTVSGINIKLTLDQLGVLVNESVSFSNTGPAEEGTSYTIDAATHGLGLDSSIIMVQLVEVLSGETVYTDVTRGASGLITITFAASQAVDSFRALLQKIG